MFFSFRDLPPSQLHQAGGKGSMLVRLFQRRFPVPDGFVILPDAFAGDDLKPGVQEQLQYRLNEWRHTAPDLSLAVRSSALNEDSAQVSFAGEFETVLDVKTDEALYEAIRVVRRSRDSERVKAYSEGQGIEGQHEIAVVVQEFVRADYAGVLFTTDPITGNLNEMTGNFVRGGGEKLVSGEENPRTFTLHRPGGKYAGPDELRPLAKRLYRLAERLDKDLGAPQDIEWAAAGATIYLLQARPITTLQAFNPVTGEWNDTLTGDFLWSNGNAAEIQPNVQPLLSWTIGKDWGHGYGSWWYPRYPMNGNICGRCYFNLTVQIAPFARLPRFNLQGSLRFVEIWWGRVPPDITVPLMPTTIRQGIACLLAFGIGWRRSAKIRVRIPEFITQAPSWCREMRQRVQQAPDRAALIRLWKDDIQPYYFLGTALAGAANSNIQRQVESELRKLVGDADTNALISNLGGQSYLESLGPLVSLDKVARGEMSREAYLERYGHRSPDEFDLTCPQPVDNPAWLDNQLAAFAQHPVDVNALLDKQRANFAAAWDRFCTRYPGKVQAVRRRLDEVARLAQQREEARSEITRVMGVVRAWILRVGNLTSLDSDVFHLTLDELLAVLAGDESACRYLPARKATYARYAALPPYPPVISGRFDPFQWAADPHRRSDVYDSHVSMPRPDSRIVTGFPGAAGIVEGQVRRIDCFEEGPSLQPGEILVTSTTNVGWTLLFPRAAAVVTDVGAPLSHAVIVARELGIPAVVGCIDATARLHTGDRVRVNGGQGTIEILQSARMADPC